MKLYKSLLIFFFIFSCTPKNIEKERESRKRNTNQETTESKTDRQTDRRENQRDSGRDYRSAELRRLKGSSSPVIRSFLESRYSNPSYNYGGDDCGEISSCVDICESNFSSSFRRKCENAPAEFIKNLEEDLLKLISISDLDEVDISPAFITAVLDFDRDLLSDLIKQNMSEGDLKTFLAWIAVNENISEAFEEDRSSRDVLEDAFEKLGELNSAEKDLETGFNIGLITEDDTFLSLASDEGNEEGFVLGYKILDDSCSNKDCKLDVLCAREKKTLSRSRIFGTNRNDSVCRTSTRINGRDRRGGTCYVQGSGVWSFLEELIHEEDIRDSDFDDDIVTVESCNQFCGLVSDSNTKCSRIL